MVRSFSDVALTLVLVLLTTSFPAPVLAGATTTTTAKATPATTQTVRDANPFELKVDKLTSESVAFSWTRVRGAYQYRIELSRDGKDFFSSSLIDPGLMDYDFGGFDPGESFVFRAVALDQRGKELATSKLVPVKIPKAAK